MNILQLGLNIDTFSAEKQKVLNDFISAFDLLSKYDNKVFNPVMGGGLIEFNTSLHETSKLLDQVKEKMSSTSGWNKNSSAKQAITEEGLAIKEYTKLADDATKTKAKLSAMTSEQAKETMALKLQLSELTKNLRENTEVAQSSLKSTIERINGIKQETIYEAENNEMKMQAVNNLRMLAVEQDKLGVAGEQQRVAALKAEVAQEQLAIKSKQEDAASTKALASDYEILKLAMVDQAKAYQNAYTTTGPKSAQTKAALAEYSSTAGIVSDIDKNLNKATASSGLFGSALRGAFGQLRTLAYILPGIGIAGLFNVAFEAISKAAEATGVFNNRLEEYLKYETAINKSLDDQILSSERLYNLQKDLNNTTDVSETHKRVTDVDQAKGVDAVTAAQRKLQQSSDDLVKSDIEAMRTGNSPETLKKDLERRLGVINNFTQQIEKLQARIDEATDPNRNAKQIERNRKAGLPLGAVRIGQNADPEKLKKQKEDLEAQLKVTQDSYNIDNGYYTKSLKLTEDYFVDRAALSKVNADQERKFHVETVKEDISLEIERNNKILSNERSTQAERLRALRNIENQNKNLNSINLFNILDNPTSTSREKDIARNKAADDNIKNIISTNEKIDRVNTEFYQRSLRAKTEIDKSEIESRAITDEKIADNEQKSLDERISALNSYIEKRQSIEDLYLNRDLQQGANKVGGKTSLLPEEATEKVSKAQEQKVSIQADVEKKVYDIVYSSAQKQLRLIVDTNKTFENRSKEQYLTDLTNLNNSFEEKKINYKAYRQERIAIDEKYRNTELVDTIKDDQKQLDNLKNFYNEQKSLQTKAFEDLKEKKANDDGSLVSKRDIDEAQGLYDGYTKSIEDAGVKITDSETRLRDDRLKQTQAHYQELGKIEEEHKRNRLQIEKDIANFVKTLVDGETQQRIEALQLRQQTIDEQYTSEIDAVNKSSLSLKDKQALDVQLNEQKKEFDKASSVEQRHLKHEQAVFDRDMALAQIAWETEIAIMAAFQDYKGLPGVAEAFAIERGILGAIAAATVLATPIPSYALGTENHPGGMARYGEAGWEVVKEPYKSPYLVMQETISYLPKGTEVIPIKESPEFAEKKQDGGWEQTRWLAKQINKNKAEPAKIVNNFSVDFGTEIWKQKILGN